jgi:hypothetical protein
MPAQRKYPKYPEELYEHAVRWSWRSGPGMRGPVRVPARSVHGRPASASRIFVISSGEVAALTVRGGLEPRSLAYTRSTTAPA